MIGDEAVVAADVLEVRRGPGGEQVDEVRGAGARNRSLRSLPTGTRSQWPSPMRTTASASRSQSSLARSPVRASTSTTSRSRGSAAARAAVMSRAASRSSRNLGGGSGRGGMSRPMIGFRAGASGQSHSMIRSKNTRSIAEPLALGVRGEPHPLGAGLSGEPHLEVLDVIPADRRDRNDICRRDQPACEQPQRQVGGVNAGGSQERRHLLEVTAHGVREAWRAGGDLSPLALRPRSSRLHAGTAVISSSPPGCRGALRPRPGRRRSATPAARYSPASQSLARCR